jgi:hypothetical protein
VAPKVDLARMMSKRSRLPRPGLGPPWPASRPASISEQRCLGTLPDAGVSRSAVSPAPLRISVPEEAVARIQSRVSTPQHLGYRRAATSTCCGTATPNPIRATASERSNQCGFATASASSAQLAGCRVPSGCRPWITRSDDDTFTFCETPRGRRSPRLEVAIGGRSGLESQR